MDTAPRIAEKMAALAAMGFQRADSTPIPTEVVPVSGGRHKLTRSEPSMGTLVSVTAIHSSRALLDDAVGRAFLEMERVVNLLNRYDPASAVSLLNDTGIIRAPPPELSTVLEGALGHHRATRGRFDPTVQPLVDLFRTGPASVHPPGTAPSLPSSDDIRELLPLVDAEAIHFQSRSIRLERDGMGITLDGIGKGYVVDRTADILSNNGIRDFLINAGGDIRSAGVREDGSPWRIAVQDPKKNGEFPDRIELTHGAVATSGSYEIYFDPEGDHHHILNSRDGASPRNTLSVSVVAPTAMEADALATGVFLMGPTQGTAYIESLPGCASLIIHRQGQCVRSSRWPSAGTSPFTKAEIP